MKMSMIVLFDNLLNLNKI